MTRKNMKGITGKGHNTLTQRYRVGPGISFKDKNLTNSAQIREAVKEQEGEQ